jgi:hypothetical protein
MYVSDSSCPKTLLAEKFETISGIMESVITMMVALLKEGNIPILQYGRYYD